MLKQKLFQNNLPSIEGFAIYFIVGYETLSLTINFIFGKKVLPPITELLGPLTHSRFGKIIVWLFLGWAWDHFWKKGETMRIEKLVAELSGE